MEQYIDHHSFLIEHNLFTDEMKDNIAMAGHCIVERTKDVTTRMDFNDNHITYFLLLPGDLYDNLKLLERFKNGEKIGFWKSRKLRSFLREKKKIEEANSKEFGFDGFGAMGYNLDLIANKFIKAYLGVKWSASVEIFNADDKDESENFGVRSSGNKPTD